MDTERRHGPRQLAAAAIRGRRPCPLLDHRKRLQRARARRMDHRGRGRWPERPPGAHRVRGGRAPRPHPRPGRRPCVHQRPAVEPAVARLGHRGPSDLGADRAPIPERAQSRDDRTRHMAHHPSPPRGPRHRNRAHPHHRGRGRHAGERGRAQRVRVRHGPHPPFGLRGHGRGTGQRPLHPPAAGRRGRRHRPLHRAIRNPHRPPPGQRSEHLRRHGLAGHSGHPRPHRRITRHPGPAHPARERRPPRHRRPNPQGPGPRPGSTPQGPPGLDQGPHRRALRRRSSHRPPLAQHAAPQGGHFRSIRVSTPPHGAPRARENGPMPTPGQQPLPQPGAVVGYARVSTREQTASLDEQRERLTQLGAVRVFEDVASGARADRPGLAAARDFMRDGDTLTVTRLDRLGRSMLDTLTTLRDLDAAGIRVRALDLNLDTGTAAGRMVVHVMAALSEYERELLAERTREGLAHARAQGRTGGRRPSLTPQQVEAITATLAAGMSIRDVATMHGVSERTISRVRAGIYGQSKRPQT
uniref:Putative DNA-invertase n=2 Tax=Micrococcaceae TaxID=1268 RepID=Q8VPR7_9MICC|nr:putative DNA-invertase [Micrococcus sp. 28]